MVLLCDFLQYEHLLHESHAIDASRCFIRLIELSDGDRTFAPRIPSICTPSLSTCAMRKSFDGLFGNIKKDLKRDVCDGGVFMFLNPRRNRIKLLYWDTDGIAIWMKRLERGCFLLSHVSDGKHVLIHAAELQWILSGVELEWIRKRKRMSRRSWKLLIHSHNQDRKNILVYPVFHRPTFLLFWPIVLPNGHAGREGTAERMEHRVRHDSRAI